jgi:hypothetical protein
LVFRLGSYVVHDKARTDINQCMLDLRRVGLISSISTSLRYTYV